MFGLGLPRFLQAQCPSKDRGSLAYSAKHTCPSPRSTSLVRHRHGLGTFSQEVFIPKAKPSRSVHLAPISALSGGEPEDDLEVGERPPVKFLGSPELYGLDEETYLLWREHAESQVMVFKLIAAMYKDTTEELDLRSAMSDDRAPKTTESDSASWLPEDMMWAPDMLKSLNSGLQGILKKYLPPQQFDKAIGEVPAEGFDDPAQYPPSRIPNILREPWEAQASIFLGFLLKRYEPYLRETNKGYTNLSGSVEGKKNLLDLHAELEMLAIPTYYIFENITSQQELLLFREVSDPADWQRLTDSYARFASISAPNQGAIETSIAALSAWVKAMIREGDAELAKRKSIRGL